MFFMFVFQVSIYGCISKTAPPKRKSDLILITEPGNSRCLLNAQNIFTMECSDKEQGISNTECPFILLDPKDVLQASLKVFDIFSIYVLFGYP